LSHSTGTLLYIGIEEGNTAPVDSLLAIIGPAGTDISGIATSKQMQNPKKVNQFQKRKTGYNSNYKFCGTRRSY
jgi:pyruvate/2-oxoglutarate dehydrogenase complex dihydrolipoamide acyltransferase (E2) component